MKTEPNQPLNREVLRQALIERFAAQPEVTSIHLFGKEALGDHDAYSDIDMIVCSNELAKTQRHYQTLFASISPVRGTLLLETSPENLSQMVLLEACSPYQKVDFSIVNNIAYKVERDFRAISVCLRIRRSTATGKDSIGSC